MFVPVCSFAEISDKPDQWFGWTNDPYTNTDYTVFGTVDQATDIFSASTVTAAATVTTALTLPENTDYIVVTIRSGTADMVIRYATSVLYATAISGIINCASFKIGLFSRMADAGFYSENHIKIGNPPPFYLPNVSSAEVVQYYQLNLANEKSKFLQHFGTYVISTEGIRYLVLWLTPKVIATVADGVTYINTNGITVCIKSGFY